MMIVRRTRDSAVTNSEQQLTLKKVALSDEGEPPPHFTLYCYVICNGHGSVSFACVVALCRLLVNVRRGVKPNLINHVIKCGVKESLYGPEVILLLRLRQPLGRSRQIVLCVVISTLRGNGEQSCDNCASDQIIAGVGMSTLVATCLWQIYFKSLLIAEGGLRVACDKTRERSVEEEEKNGRGFFLLSFSASLHLQRVTKYCKNSDLSRHIHRCQRRKFLKNWWKRWRVVLWQRRQNKTVSPSVKVEIASYI